MPNPRYMSYGGEPSVELLDKMTRAKQVYIGNLGWFCPKHAFEPKDFRDVRGVFLIGSHATDSDWKDDTSDLDLKLIVPAPLPAQLHTYKREVLDRLLHEGEKKRWIDLFFAREDYQVTLPRWDVTSYWNGLSIE